MRTINDLRTEVDAWRGAERDNADLIDLWDLSDGDEAMQADVDASAQELEARLEKLEFQVLLSGEYDRSNAIMAIHAGAGGTESQDWAAMLQRMYLRWAERRGFKAEVFDESPGEEAGIKSATIEISGAFAYGYLKSERGVHRLVRISPFDASHSRHTSFALVEVLPEVDDRVSVEINPDDLRIDVFRSSGAGGQNVQKNSTAIRITHIPTGIVVACQNERSQLQNREMAMKILESRLLEKELEKRAEEQARLKGEHVTAGWGNQIRNYVLQPYKLVKDNRTNQESTNPQAVLDGEIDEFLEAFLKASIGQDVRV
jgi:peptide chain release factor 2